MFQTKCFKIRLKPDSLERVREWANEINSRQAEALETLRDEGIVIESVFLEQSDEGDFLIYYMKAEDFDLATKAFEKSSHSIDAYHQQFKNETWLDGKPLELLIDLDRIAEFKA